MLLCLHDKSSFRARFWPPFKGQSAEFGLQSIKICIYNTQQTKAWSELAARWCQYLVARAPPTGVWCNYNDFSFSSLPPLSLSLSWIGVNKWSRWTHTWLWHCLRRKPRALANISRANWTALPCDCKRQYLSVAANIHSRKAWWALHMQINKGNHIRVSTKLSISIRTLKITSRSARWIWRKPKLGWQDCRIVSCTWRRPLLTTWCRARVVDNLPI